MQKFHKEVQMYLVLADVYLCYNRVTNDYLILTEIGVNAWFSAYGIFAEEVLEVVLPPRGKRASLRT